MATANELAPNTPGVDHQGRLAHVPSGLVPPTVVGPIFEKAQENSLVLRMGERIPVDYNGTTIPVNVKRPEVGQVGVGTSNEDREGHRKPLTGVAWDTKTFAPIKLAAIVTASKEFVDKNPAGLWSQVQNDLGYAMGRGIDLAVAHGLSPLTGAPLQGVDPNNVLANTTKAVSLDASGTTLVDNLLSMYAQASAGDKEFNAWAADPRYRAELALLSAVRDSNGNIVNAPALNLNANVGNLLGFPVHYGRAVGGDLGAAADSGVRVIGGDFSQLKYGFADQISFRVTDQATLTDEDGQAVSLWQTNQVAILIECTFGWIVGDLDAFAKGTVTVGS